MSPVLVLARNEGERLARNPAIWVSLVPTALWVRSDRRVGQAEDQLFLLVGYGLLLPGFVMVVAVVLATLRSRLERSDELLNTLAVGPDRRSIGHVASTIFCGAIGLVATIAIYLALSPSRDLGAWDPGTRRIVTIPRPNVAQLLQGPAAVVAVAAFVIACVRWVPTWLVLLPLGFLLMVQGLFAGFYHGLTTDGVRWLYPLNTGVVNGEWSGCTPDGFECSLAVSGFDTTTPWWHLGYLSALVVWFT
ncbi:MAG TPA: hypothetical protein VMM60_10135, partial [Ilumatobacter sp.]|nr:hypothetical protein [Ilumatobacter sp.]